MTSIGLATVLGNATALVALKKARRAPSHYPLASLATADLLVGLFVAPIGAARELFVFHLDWVICTCWSTLDVLCCTASILSLCALGWERWSGITAPLGRARRAKRAKLYAALVWPAATVVALPTAFVPSPKHYLPGEPPKACTVNTNVGYVFFSTFMSFYLPACLMVAFYTRILNALATLPPIRSHRGRMPCVKGDQGKVLTPTRNNGNVTPKDVLKEHIKKVTVYISPKPERLDIPVTNSPAVRRPSPMKTLSSPRSNLTRQRKATHSIVMLMSMFLICWTPFFVMILIDSLCECVSDSAWQWCTWLGYANSALNPIVYGAASPSVRRVLLSIPSTSTTTTEVPITPVTSRRT